MNETDDARRRKTKAPDPGSESRSEGYERAVALLQKCSTEDGFLATPSGDSNYRRIWGRDGSVMALAALASGREDLVDAARRTLETLAGHQGPHGEIPSNVDTGTSRISYGGTAGRVDADLWFLIACGEYRRRTGDESFTDRMLPAMEKTRFLLGAWEFNARGLLYVPQTGDWADEYVHNGYVLLDEILYLQAQRVMCDTHRRVHGSVDHDLMEKVSRLRHLIRANYWFADGCPVEDYYHEVLHRHGEKAAEKRDGPYWMPFFGPTGYGYRFDAFANVLVSLFGVADDGQRGQVDAYIDERARPGDAPLLPAFHPVIKPVDDDWEDLNVTFSYTFKNRPHEYHNGGLWPVITGFHAADLARRGRRDRAAAFLEGVHRANAMEMDGEPWAFPEYVHGTELTPGGNREQGWSAAAAIIGEQALHGDRVFLVSDEPGPS